MQNFLKRFENFSLNIINKTENIQISFWTWLTSLFCIVFLRNFLETFSSRINFFSAGTFAFVFFHSIAFYLLVFLILSLFLYAITGEKIEKITRASLFASLLLLLPPILDIIVSGGKGVFNSYITNIPGLSPGPVEMLATALKDGAYSPFLSKDFHTMNFGIRIEVLILMLLMIYYIFLKTKKASGMIAAFILFQPIVFFIASFPYWLSKISGVNIFNKISILNPGFTWNYVLFSLYLIFILILGFFWLRAWDKEKARALIKNIRPFRAIQIIAVFLFGLYIAGITTAPIKIFDYLVIVTACISLLLYWISAVLFNDLTDLEGDLINEPRRPLPSGKLETQETKSLAVAFLLLSYISAFAVNYVLFIAILFRSALAYLYSNKPFRLKTIPFLSTFVLALAAFSTVLGGYLMLPEKSIYDFPLNVVLLILIAFTLGFNAKDIKDYTGDKAEGIKTLPVILGLKNGKLVIGLLSLICFLAVPILFSKNIAIILPTSIITGLCSFYFITKKKYSETPLFFIYFSYAILASFIIF